MPSKNPSGHRVPEGSIQAQWPLQTPRRAINRRTAQEGVQRISDANIKHGRQTKDKLAAQRHAAKVGRRVRGELKRIEKQIVDAGLMPQ
jgi:hypothetical protein